MIVVSSLSSGDRDATLTDFPFEENSKLSPKVSRSTFSSGFKSSYTGGFGNIGQLMREISARQIGVTIKLFPLTNILAHPL